MDVFVVLNCAWRDGAEVAGVATDLASAQRLADGLKDDDPRITGWAEWKTAATGQGFPEWTRDALTEDGIHPSSYQQIVQAKSA